MSLSPSFVKTLKTSRDMAAEVMAALWENIRNPHDLLVPARVATEALLTQSERQQLRRKHNLAGGLYPSSVTNVREIFQSVLGITIALSDAQVSSMIEEFATSSARGRSGNHGPELDQDGLEELALMIKRRIYEYDGQDDLVHLLSTAKQLQFNDESDEAEGGTDREGLVSNKWNQLTLAADTPFLDISFHSPSLSEEPPGDDVIALVTATPMGFLPPGDLSEEELSQLNFAQRLFGDLGGNLNDPCSTISCSKVRRFVTTLLKTCGERDHSIEKHLDRFERLYSHLTFHDLETEVVQPIYQILPRRILDATTRRKQQYKSISQGTDPGSGWDRTDLLAQTVRSLERTKRSTTIVESQGRFQTVVREVQIMNSTTQQLQAAFVRLAQATQERQQLITHVLDNAESVFKAKCTLDAVHLQHLTSLRPFLINRFVRQVSLLRNRVASGKRARYVGMLLKALSLASIRIVDHTSNCEHCKKLTDLRQRKGDLEVAYSSRRSPNRDHRRSPRRRQRGTDKSSVHLKEDLEIEKLIRTSRDTYEQVRQLELILPPRPPPAGNTSRPLSAKSPRDASLPSGATHPDRFVRMLHQRLRKEEERTKERAEHARRFVFSSEVERTGVAVRAHDPVWFDPDWTTESKGNGGSGGREASVTTQKSTPYAINSAVEAPELERPKRFSTKVQSLYRSDTKQQPALPEGGYHHSKPFLLLAEDFRVLKARQGQEKKRLLPGKKKSFFSSTKGNPTEARRLSTEKGRLPPRPPTEGTFVL
jgi:hypothetical protein